MATKKSKSRSKTTSSTLRFAHPFFTTTPIPERPNGRRLLDHIIGKLEPVPPATGDSVMTLASIIGAAGAQQIADSGSIRFHAVGDTGRQADSPQGSVANAMTLDFNVGQPAKSPAFFFHLGDVIYGPGKDQSYRREFYEPYAHYPGKIIAIPGNHDGEVFAGTDPKTLKAFRANFCASSQKVPDIAGTIFRETMNQPGVYWLVDAPFVQIVGLYSNAAENPGFISGKIPGSAQKTWLIQTLKRLAKLRAAGDRRALVIATHHPPFSAGGHSPSIDMLADIDDACQKGGLMPDLFLSAHVHSYQRYHRRITFAGRKMEIPFIVAGTGGINDRPIAKANGQVSGDHVFLGSRQGYGYLLLTADKKAVTCKMVGVENETRADYESVTVDLATNTAG